MIPSQATWVNVLKQLREGGDVVLLSAVSNLSVVFTHETITVVAPNKSMYEFLTKNTAKLGGAIIKLKTAAQKELTVEQKLKGLFGEKLKVEQ